MPHWTFSSLLSVAVNASPTPSAGAALGQDKDTNPNPQVGHRCAALPNPTLQYTAQILTLTPG